MLEVGNTSPDPSHTGTHAVISAAGVEVLISYLALQPVSGWAVT
jgi:hypothetical protein